MPRATRRDSAPDPIGANLHSTRDSIRPGAILVGQSSASIKHYLFPGEDGYEDAQDRENAERLRDDASDNQSDNQLDRDLTDLDTLIANAKASYDNQNRMKLMETEQISYFPRTENSI